MAARDEPRREAGARARAAGAERKGSGGIDPHATWWAEAVAATWAHPSPAEDTRVACGQDRISLFLGQGAVRNGVSEPFLERRAERHPGV
jgi:hypothetical protein